MEEKKPERLWKPHLIAKTEQNSKKGAHFFFDTFTNSYF